MSLPITVTERHHRLGTSAAIVVEAGSAFIGNYFARITPKACGIAQGTRFEVRTKSFNKGSVRYRDFPTYPMALAYALEWANRKSRELARTNQGA